MLHMGLASDSFEKKKGEGGGSDCDRSSGRGRREEGQSFSQARSLKHHRTVAHRKLNGGKGAKMNRQGEGTQRRCCVGDGEGGGSEGRPSSDTNA